MAQYDQPVVMSYNLGNIDFGAGANVTRDIPLPLGAQQARVLEVLIHATEVFATSTLNARVQVGRTGDLDEFAELIIPTGTAVGAMRGFRAAGGGLNSIYQAGAGGLAELDALRVTAVFGTDASAVTGQAEVTVVVGYDYVKADL